MKHVLIIACLLAGTNNVYCQTDTLAKHEVGINLLSVINIAGGGLNRFYNKNSVHYKYGIKKNVFLRAEFMYTPANGYTSLAVPILVKDSLTNECLYYNHVYKPVIQVNGGIEYRWGKKRIRYFAGADLGYKHFEYSENMYYTERPTNRLPEYNPTTSGADYRVSFKSTDELRNVNKSTGNSLLLMPCYGLQFHFSRSFFFSAQVRAIIEVARIKTTSGYPSHPGSYSYNNLNFNLIPLDNFSLCYKF